MIIKFIKKREEKHVRIAYEEGKAWASDALKNGRDPEEITHLAAGTFNRTKREDAFDAGVSDALALLKGEK